MSDKPTNPNWIETEEGWERNPSGTPAQGVQIDWGRIDSVKEAREGVSDLRERQNQRNEEYKKNHRS